MNRRALSLALWAGAFVAAGQGCSGTSVVIGGDPLDSAGGVVNGGAMAFGGAFATGGAYGGTSTVGGSAPIGGTSTGAGGSVNGGTSTYTGGTSGTYGGNAAEGGDGNVFDPYPYVEYEGGQGYRRSCPQYDDTWGFTCWNFDGEPRACSPTGDPYCNACSCATPRCNVGEFQCPVDSTCVGSETTATSCFLECNGVCPAGMTCSRYPGSNSMVCVWVSVEPT